MCYLDQHLCNHRGHPNRGSRWTSLGRRGCATWPPTSRRYAARSPLIRTERANEGGPHALRAKCWIERQCWLRQSGNTLRTCSLLGCGTSHSSLSTSELAPICSLALRRASETSGTAEMKRYFAYGNLLCEENVNHLGGTEGRVKVHFVDVQRSQCRLWVKSDERSQRLVLETEVPCVKDAKCDGFPGQVQCLETKPESNVSPAHS